MNTEFFIAKRIIKGRNYSKKISKPIIVISVAAIAIGIALMILSTAIVTGFQTEIRNKVIGFGSHIQITDFSGSSSYETSPILIESYGFYDSIVERIPEVAHAQVFATKPGMLQTKTDIQAIIAKGIDENFDWSFFENKMVEGTSLKTKEHPNSLLISKYLAQKLQLTVNDNIKVFFHSLSAKGQNKLKPRKFIIQGVYETGLDDFDKQFVFVDISHIQKLNKWGVNIAAVYPTGNIVNGMASVKAVVHGGNKDYRYNWSETGYSSSDSLVFCTDTTTIISLVVSDVKRSDVEDELILNSVPDTAWLTVTPRKKLSDCSADTALFDFSLKTAGGSGKYYVGGFELLLNDYKDLLRADDIVSEELLHTKLYTRTITRQYSEIFDWLKMIDINVVIIIILMIMVGIINMTSSLLILIIERTNMIGILKALGTNNWSIRKIFLYNASYLVIKGLLIGNIIGIGLALIQQQFGIITLPQESYYVSEVPIKLELSAILMLNAGSLIICVLALIIPSLIVTKISPVKAIRFD